MRSNKVTIKQGTPVALPEHVGRTPDLNVTYRQIAKLFASRLPVEGEDFRDCVESYLREIKHLSKQNRVALKAAYVFASKVPREEREDMYQQLVLGILKAQTEDERLAYAVAKCDWVNWWQAYKIRQHISLNQPIEDEDGNECDWGDRLVGECEFERKMDGELDAPAIWNTLPCHIRAIVAKKLDGLPLVRGEGVFLKSWSARNMTILRDWTLT